MGKNKKKRQRRAFTPAAEAIQIERDSGSFVGRFRGGVELRIKFNDTLQPFDADGYVHSSAATGSDDEPEGAPES